MPSPPPLIQVGVVESLFYLKHQVEIIRTPEYFEVICILINFHPYLLILYASTVLLQAQIHCLMNFQVFFKPPFNFKKTFTCLASTTSTLIYQV